MTSPFVRRRRLAQELCSLRERGGMTAERLAQLVHASRTRITELENAQIRPDLVEVMTILDALGITGDKWREVVSLARDAAPSGWWDSIGDAMGARQRMYADIESGATTIRGYNQNSLPGLLQAPEFTWALIELDETEGGEMGYVPERSVAARRQRQRAAFRAGGPSFEIVLDELVLKRLAVAPDIMARQLRHMVDVLTRQPRFVVRVLLSEARLSPGRLPRSTYMIYTFPDRADPPMVVAETTSGGLIHTAIPEVAKYERLHDRLQRAALPAPESISLLAETADRLSEQVGREK